MLDIAVSDEMDDIILCPGDVLFVQIKQMPNAVLQNYIFNQS